MKLNVLNTDPACTACIKGYSKKHNLKKGDQFEIKCRGIPKTFSEGIPLQGTDPYMLLDPVAWAREVLNWHCLDPDNEVWKKQDLVEYTRMQEEYPGRASKFHRPYQVAPLRCTSRRKVFRWGRQSGKSETMIISIMYHLFTQSNFKILLLTPFSSQIEMIFKRIKDLIESNLELKNSVKRDVSSPYATIELYNGSVLKGFTAGSKGSNGAASIRGQTANMLVLDEADFLQAADLDAAMSIVTNFPDATVWISSTPSGKREKFYEICHSPDWKEYHYSSDINPNWNEQTDKLFREMLTHIGYLQEVKAEFGDLAQGVFQRSYIDSAQQDYEYSDMTPQSNWLYSLGVDWNSPAIGTTISIVGFNPSTNKFRKVHNEIVQRAEWTQLKACERIVELNRIWKPFAMYVDKGFGSSQIEVLRKYGFDAMADPTKGKNHPDTKIVSILKAYDFGSQIEIRDPFTKQPIQKPAKAFLVENTVRRLEQMEFEYPKSDEQLTKEFGNYIIASISDRNHVKYGQVNESVGDHQLDSLMLALVAFTLEKSQFSYQMPILTPEVHQPKKNEDIPVSEQPTRMGNKNQMHPNATSPRTNLNPPLKSYSGGPVHVESPKIQKRPTNISMSRGIMSSGRKNI